MFCPNHPNEIMGEESENFGVALVSKEKYDTSVKAWKCFDWKMGFNQPNGWICTNSIPIIGDDFIQIWYEKWQRHVSCVHPMSVTDHGYYGRQNVPHVILWEYSGIHFQYWSRVVWILFSGVSEHRPDALRTTK